MAITAERSVTVRVDLDDKGFDGGMKNVDKRLGDTDQSTKVLNKDMTSFKDTLGTVGNVFGKLAVLGSAAITGLAASSPALSGTFARLKVETMEFANEIGKALKPGLDIAVDAFSRFVDYVKANPTFTSIATHATLAAAAIVGLSKALAFLSIPTFAAGPVIAYAAAVAALTAGVVKLSSALGEALVRQFSFEGAVTPPEDQGYKFKPGTMSVYDQASMGGSLSGATPGGLPSSSPGRVWDNEIGGYRLETRQDRDQAIIDNAAKNIQLNLNLTVKNDGSDQQKISRQMLISPSFS